MNLEELTNDNELAIVPEDDRVSGWRISLIIIGIAIGLPLMLTGAELGRQMPLREAFLAVFTGGAILGGLAAITGTIGARTRISTYLLTESAFGKVGARFVNFVLIITILGWFGVTAAVFGDALSHSIERVFSVVVPADIFTAFGTILMIATSIFGFKLLDKLALLAVPLLIVLLGSLTIYGLKVGLDHPVPPSSQSVLSYGQATSLVIGSFIVGVVLFPDYCRYAKKASDGAFAGILSLGIGVPVVLIASIIPAKATGQSDLVELLFEVGAGGPALILLVIATWTTNASNLYSASLALSVQFKKIARWKMTVVAGVVGGAMAVAGIADQLMQYLVVLSVAIPPIAGLYIADFLLKQNSVKVKDTIGGQSINWPAFVSWAIGIIMGILTSKGIVTVTTFPAIDSLVFACVVYVIYRQLIKLN